MKQLLFLLALPLLAQGSLTLTPPSNPRAGGAATWTVTLSGNTNPADIQLSFSCDRATGLVAVTPVGTALAAGKTAYAANGNAVLTGMNQTVIADGVILNISVVLPFALANVNLTCSIQGTPPLIPTLGASPAGIVIAETANPPVSVLILPSLSLCDVNGSGQTDSTDVTIERTAVLNQTAADRNSDGKTDVVDLRIIINAALGVGCTATQ